jgi:hypothetical protein
MVRLADSAGTKGAGTCLRPREEAWDGFPLFAFVGGGDVMRKTLVLVAVSLLFLWATQASACYRSLARPKFGDPDEFQTQVYHDETGQRLPIGCRSDGRRQASMRAADGEAQFTVRERRYLSINFAGRTFFLEK